MALFGKRRDCIDRLQCVRRQPILVSASILALERSLCATLERISSTDARLIGCENLAPGDALWIKVGCLDKLATVTSSAGDYYVIAFDTPLDDDDVRHLRCEGRNTLVMPLDPEEREGVQSWIDSPVH